MPRKARSSFGGLVYHVWNRAAGRIRMFRSDPDFTAFERVLAEAHHTIRLDGRPSNEKKSNDAIETRYVPVSFPPIDSSKDFATFKQKLQTWADTRLVGGAKALPPGLRPNGG